MFIKLSILFCANVVVLLICPFAGNKAVVNAWCIIAIMIEILQTYFSYGH